MNRRKSLTHALIAWICLYSLGLDFAFHAMEHVADASHGADHLEWNCEKDATGTCVHLHVRMTEGAKSNKPQMPPGEDHPEDSVHCEGQHLLTRATHDVVVNIAFPPESPRSLPTSACESAGFRLATLPTGRVRAPDRLAQLRSIIIIV